MVVSAIHNPSNKLLFYSSTHSRYPYLNFQNMDPNKPLRILLKFKVEDIAADPPTKRANILANAFLGRYFQREFHFDRDWMHVPCNIDSAKGSAYLFLDINANMGPSVTAVDVPLHCYMLKPKHNTQELVDHLAPNGQNETLYYPLPALCTVNSSLRTETSRKPTFSTLDIIAPCSRGEGRRLSKFEMLVICSCCL